MSHRFIPGAEQLESKLLFAITPLPVMESMPVVEMSGPFETTPDAPTQDQCALLRTERHDGNIVLVAQFEHELQRTLHVLGGDSVTTLADGTARLPLPSHARIVELAIQDESGEQVSAVRLELSEDGQIVSQSWSSEYRPNELDNHNEIDAHNTQGMLLMAPSHMATVHSSATAKASFATSNAGSHSSISTSEHDRSLSGVEVDEFMDHEYAMPMQSADAHHNAATAGYSRGQHTVETQDLSVVVEVDDAVGIVQHETGEGGISATSTAPSPELESPVSDDVDVILAGWTSGQLPENNPILQVDPIPPVPTEVLANGSAERDGDSQRPVALVSYFADVDQSRAGEQPEFPSCANIGAILASVAAAGAAFACVRRAEQLSENLQIR